MKYLTFFLIAFLLINSFVMAQDANNKNLCVGHYYTEAEGKKVLADLQKEYQTKNQQSPCKKKRFAQVGNGEYPAAVEKKGSRC